MATSPPTSQRPGERPIAFLLDDQVSGLGPVPAHTLYVRPEDLTRDDPSRVNIVQTMNGGAWADDFGPGVAMITIAGHTGWRRGEGSNDDGEARFKALRAQVFEEWHKRRAQAVANSKDPAGVGLIFSDSLDSIVATVAPMRFVLRRSRSRPLLLQYQIQMAVLADGVATGLILPAGQVSKSVLTSLGLDSLEASLKKIEAFAASAKSVIDRELLAPVQSFLGVTQAVYGRVTQTINSITSVPASLISVAQTSAAAGANLFRTFALVANLPTLVRGQLMEVSAAYNNIACVLRNALATPDQFLDYSSIYGASGCSSTAGGRAISAFGSSNTFAVVAPAPTADIVSVSTAAQASMTTLARSDVVLQPMDTDLAAFHAGAVGAGVVLQ